MGTFLIFLCCCVVLGVLYKFVNGKLNPLVPPASEEIRLRRWEEIVRSTKNYYRMYSAGQRYYELDINYNPMEIALFYRQILVDLLQTGHARASRSVMSDVDAIISTIEANHYALRKYGYGNWEFSCYDIRGFKTFKWKMNDGEGFQSLWKETIDMLNSIKSLIEYVRSIAKEGVASSLESAKVHLQVHLQDFTAAKDANMATAKELEERPL